MSDALPFAEEDPSLPSWLHCCARDAAARGSAPAQAVQCSTGNAAADSAFHSFCQHLLFKKIKEGEAVLRGSLGDEGGFFIFSNSALQKCSI